MYGTFRSGQPARALLEPHIRSSRSASVAGRIVALPEGYPALLDPKVHKPGEARVVGDLVELRDLASALALADAYEDEYERVLVEVTIDTGETLWAWCYQLNVSHKAVSGEPIPSGDWVAHLGKVRAVP